MEGPDFEQEKIERLRRAMYSRSLSDKIKDRPRRQLQDQVPRVGDDFIRPEETAPASTVAPRAIVWARATLWWLLAGAVIFFIGAVGFFTYYFVFGAGSSAASPRNIDISVVGPPQIEGGVPTELQIVVQNRNKVPLELAELVVTFPNGTRSPVDFSADYPKLRKSLGTIEPGGTLQGTISAIFVGDEGVGATVKVEVEYHIAGSNAIFTASTNYDFVFSSSPVSVAIAGNTDTISGQPVELTVTVASNANAPLVDVVLSAQYPFGFKLASASPAPATSGLWEIGTLSPGERQTITVRGTLTGDQGDERVFRFIAGTRKTATSTTVDTPLSDHPFTVSISKPFLGLSVSINGSDAGTSVVSPGDNVNVSISWQNNLPTAIRNAVIVARLSGVQIDGSAVRTTDGFYRSTDTVVLWDKTTTNGVFNELAAGSHGTVSFSFQVPSSDTLTNVVNPQLTISINAAGSRVSESGVPQTLQATASKKISFASDVQLDTRGLYYSSPLGASGPIPPKAGTETTYAIVFTVTNTTNKVRDAWVTAVLPPYVRWVGVYSPPSADMKFNQSDGTVQWHIGDIEIGTGVGSSTPRQAAIEIGFTPSTSQIGQEPVLLGSITLSGIDDATGERIAKTVKDVTTNILGDPGFSAANATVVK